MELDNFKDPGDERYKNQEKEKENDENIINSYNDKTEKTKKIIENKIKHSNNKFEILNVSHKQSKIDIQVHEKYHQNYTPEIFSMRYSPNDIYLAAGYSNGNISILDINEDFKTKIKIHASSYAVTSLRFKGADSMIISVTADGKIATYHTKTGKLLYLIEEKEPLMCLDVSPSASSFAVGGHGKVVKLYDDETKTLIRELHGNYNHVGHSNRIFAVNFHKTDYNLLASGGWDSIVVFYDIRQQNVIGNSLGAHICGDALDMRGNYVLTGSWSSKEQIKIFDIRTFKKIETIKWEYEENNHSTGVYCAQFSKKGNGFENLYFGVGGSNINQFRLWDFNDNKGRDDNFCCEEFETLDEKQPYGGPIYCMDFSNRLRNTVSFGCGDGYIRTYELKEKFS